MNDSSLHFIVPWQLQHMFVEYLFIYLFYFEIFISKRKILEGSVFSFTKFCSLDLFFGVKV